jgi:hypothetical protein
MYHRTSFINGQKKKEKKFFLRPSGYSDSVKRGGEMGSNGLTLDPMVSLYFASTVTGKWQEWTLLLMSPGLYSYPLPIITKEKNSIVRMMLCITAPVNCFSPIRLMALKSS